MSTRRSSKVRLAWHVLRGRPVMYRMHMVGNTVHVDRTVRCHENHFENAGMTFVDRV